MTIIALSQRAAAADPALAAWLAGCGLRVAAMAGDAPRERGEVRILHVSEIVSASHRDVLIELAEGAPVLVRAADGQPARIRFGFADMAFAHALIAELVRPADRPACGEPDSARFLSLAAKIARQRRDRAGARRDRHRQGGRRPLHPRRRRRARTSRSSR